MADPLSIVGLGLTVVKGIVNYYEAYKDQDKNIQQTIKCLTGLATTLAALTTPLQNNHLDPMQKADVAQNIDACHDGIRRLEKKLNKICPAPSDPVNDGFRDKLRAQAKKAIYPFKGSTLVKLREIASDLRDSLELAMISLNIGASVNTLEYAVDISADVKDIKEQNMLAKRDKMRSNIQNWLSPADHSSNFHSAFEKRQPGTGEWFLNGTDLERWKVCPNSFCWLYGLPGCGKTILSATIVASMKEYCQDRPGTALAYFYFDFQDSAKQHSLGMLRSLIAQLIFFPPEVPQSIELLYSNCKNGQEQPSFSAMICALHDLMKTFTDVYFIIDALDESTERDRLGQLLQDIHGWQIPACHLIATSRRELDLECKLNPIMSMQRSLESSIVDTDIGVYINYQLNNDIKLKGKPTSSKAEIESALLQRAGGMFRWVVCQLETLRECPNKPQIIRRVLNGLPKTLDKTYERILQTVDDSRRDDAYRMLQWLCFSERGLTIEELADALAVSTDDEPSFDPSDRYDPPQDILENCRSLVTTVSEFSKPYHGHPGHQRTVVRLAHFSVKEYLMSHRTEPDWNLEKTSAHFMMAQACIAYLSYFDADQPSSTIFRGLEFPLAQYAASQWPQHARKSQGASQSVSLNSLISRFLSQGNSLRHAIAMFDCDDYMYDEENLFDKEFSNDKDMEEDWDNAIEERKKNGSPLYYAARFGLKDIVAMCLAEGAEVDALSSDTCYGLPLQAAAANGYSAIVDCLLAAGAAVDRTDGPRSHTALQEAIDTESDQRYKPLEKDRLDTVILLISAKADVNQLCDRVEYIHEYIGACSTPLQLAACNQYLGIAEVLLEAGASLDVWGGHMIISPADTAAGTGNVDLFKLILSKTTSPPKRAEYSRQALKSAARLGRLEMIKYILSTKPFIFGDDKGDFNKAASCAADRRQMETLKLLVAESQLLSDNILKYDSALQTAACRGFMDVIKYLISEGVSMLSNERTFNLALIDAAKNWQFGVVKLLVSAGADVSAQDEANRTALQATAMYGKGLKIAKFLVSQGASVNAQGGKYETALQSAAAFGDMEMARFLVSEGALVNIEGGEYGNALNAAAAEGHFNMVKFLIKKGALISAATCGPYGSALNAAATKNLDLVKFLLLEGASLNEVGEKYGSLIQAAATLPSEQAIEAVKLLTERGASVLTKGGQYSTGIQAAAKTGNVELVKFLVSEGALVSNEEGGFFGNAFCAAISSKNLDTIRFMLDNGASIDWPGRCGKSLMFNNMLEAAAYHASSEVVDFLLTLGPKVDECRALEYACRVGDIKTAQILIQAGANINLPDEMWGSALNKAINTDDTDLVKLLGYIRLEVMKPNSKYLTVMQAAEEYEFPKMQWCGKWLRGRLIKLLLD